MLSDLCRAGSGRFKRPLGRQANPKPFFNCYTSSTCCVDRAHEMIALHVLVATFLDIVDLLSKATNATLTEQAHRLHLRRTQHDQFVRRRILVKV
jgi:hypothetical protein